MIAVGGRQPDRRRNTLLAWVRVTMMLHAVCQKSDADQTDLSVICVEQGRWHETHTTFDAGESIHPSVTSLLRRRGRAGHRQLPDRVAADCGSGCGLAEVDSQHHLDHFTVEARSLVGADKHVGQVACVCHPHADRVGNLENGLQRDRRQLACWWRQSHLAINAVRADRKLGCSYSQPGQLYIVTSVELVEVDMRGRRVSKL
jgi:hypothetical protein